MRAWVCRAAGYPRDNPDGFKLEDDFPTPVPTQDQLLIRVKAVALNPIGWKTMTLAPFTWLSKRPGVPEPEFSGEVAGGALQQSSFALGDEVFGVSPFSFWKGQGALAEYTVVNTANVVRKPALLSHAEAAALPVALLTPYWSLVTMGGLKMGAGQRVFVNGGSGGVGTGAIQIAKAFGAYVVSTSSPTSASLLTSLGADALIDYRAVGSLPSYLAQHYASDSPEAFDIILDCVGLNELYVASPGYLRPEGVFLNVGAQLRGWRDVGKVIWDVLGAVARPRWAGGVPREYKFIQTPPEMTGPTLKAAFEFVSTGQVKGVIDSEFAFEDAVQAYDRFTSDRAKGKVVVHVG